MVKNSLVVYFTIILFLLITLNILSQKKANDILLFSGIESINRMSLSFSRLSEQQNLISCIKSQFRFRNIQQQNLKQESNFMQFHKNIERQDLMTLSMVVPQEKLLKSPPKKIFSPLRPYYAIKVQRNQNPQPKLNQKNYKSINKNLSKTYQLQHPLQHSPKAKPKNNVLQFLQKSPSHKTKLWNIKQVDQKQKINLIAGNFFKPSKQPIFKKNHEQFNSDQLTKEIEAVIEPKKIIKFSPPHKQTQKRIFTPSRQKQFKILLINNKKEVFQILKFLDEGSYGKVYLVKHLKTQTIYCLKSIEKSQLNEQSFNQLVRQIIIQSYLNHPNIVNLYSFTADAEYVYLLLEPCPGQNLFKRLSKEPFKQREVRKYIKEMCIAVQYMHKYDIIHRDIKPENILIHENTVKICDFGWAVHSPLLRNTQCGTPLYTPPEMVKSQYYDSKIDIWCIGVLTYELLFGTIPFEIRHPKDLSKIINQQVYFSKQAKITEVAKYFIKKCLQKNAHDRYNIRQALEDDFLTTKIQKFRQTLS